VFNKGVGKYLECDATGLEAEALVNMVADGQVHAYKHTGFWQCMDTYREQQMLEKMYASGQAPWQVWSQTGSKPRNGNGRSFAKPSWNGSDLDLARSKREVAAHTICK